MKLTLEQIEQQYLDSVAKTKALEDLFVDLRKRTERTEREWDAMCDKSDRLKQKWFQAKHRFRMNACPESDTCMSGDMCEHSKQGHWMRYDCKQTSSSCPTCTKVTNR